MDDVVDLDSARGAKPENQDDLKTVVSQVTGVSGKSMVIINKLIEELEEEKKVRQELQREI